MSTVDATVVGEEQEGVTTAGEAEGPKNFEMVAEEEEDTAAGTTPFSVYFVI
jgi:hypothetical protein